MNTTSAFTSSIASVTSAANAATTLTTVATSNATEAAPYEAYDGPEITAALYINLVLWPILALTGITLNTFCFLTLRKRAGRPPLINFYLCTLAVLDNINLFLTMFSTWAFELSDKKWNIYEKGCSTYITLWFTVGDASSYILAFCSLDRFILLFFSNRAKSLSNMRLAWISITTLLAVLFFFVNFQFLFTTVSVGDRSDYAYEYLCPAKEGHDYWVYQVVPWFLDHVLYFYIPAVVIVFCNVALIVKMKRHQKAVGMTLGKSNKKQESDQALRRSNKVLFLVSGYFIVVMAPYLTFQSFYGQFFGNAEPKRKAQGDLAYAFFTLLHTSNYCFNFFFYYYASSVFRKDFKGLFARCRRQHIEEHTTSGKDMEESVTRVQKIKAKNETLTSVGENSTN